AAALTQPDVGAELLLQLLHRMAQRRLRQAQHAGRGRQRALLLDLLHDGQVTALQHIDEPISWIVKLIPFYFMTPAAYAGDRFSHCSHRTHAMTTTHNLGFPRIGARRELKFALESY